MLESEVAQAEARIMGPALQGLLQLHEETEYLRNKLSTTPFDQIDDEVLSQVCGLQKDFKTHKADMDKLLPHGRPSTAHELMEHICDNISLAQCAAEFVVGATARPCCNTTGIRDLLSEQPVFSLELTPWLNTMFSLE